MGNCMFTHLHTIHLHTTITFNMTFHNFWISTLILNLKTTNFVFCRMKQFPLRPIANLSIDLEVKQ